MTRKPAVAGQFYTEDVRRLKSEIKTYTELGLEKKDVIGAVSPHAGYMYSGMVAGKVFSAIKPKDTFVVISPNHTGYGSSFALSSETWKTPFGVVEVDNEFNGLLLKRSHLLKEDKEAHLFEHSLEVQLPFIQHTAPSSKIVPITISGADYSELEELADSIVEVKQALNREIVIVASSDMSHYISRKEAKEKDALAIEKITSLDAKGLFNVVKNENISMCGVLPSVAMVIAGKKLNAKKAELLEYTDSGETTGDLEQVVGYAGIIIY